MSQYTKEITHILATLNERGDEDAQPLPDEEELDTIHVYPVEGGGILFTKTPLEDEEAAPPVIDSQDDHTSTRTTKTPPLFVLFVLLLCVFVVGDIADTQLIALMTPTVTIAITPDVRSVTMQSTAGAAKLWYDKPHKQFYLLVSLELDIPDPTPETLPNVVGVDVGMRYLAVTATTTNDSSFYSGKRVRAKADHYARIRKRLQKKGTRSATRRKIALSGGERDG